MPRDSNITRIYIVFTSYQFKVALVHRRTYPGTGGALLVHHQSIVPSRDELKEFDELLSFQAGTGIRSDSNRQTFQILRQRFEHLIAHADRQSVPDLFVCSIAYPLTNWLITHFVGRLRTSILIDGLSGYLPLRKPVVRELADGLRKLYVGLFIGIKTSWIFKHPQGLDSDFVHDLYAEMPALLSAHRKPVNLLPSVFEPLDASQRELARLDVWFLGQPHTLRGKKLVDLLMQLLAALRRDHPEARDFIYRTHHFEAASVSELIRSTGFKVEEGHGCVEELLCARPPIAVYSYRSTALLNLRRILPTDIPVVAFAPWLVQPPEEKLLYGDIQQWMLTLGIDRPAPASAVFALEVELGRRQTWQSQLRRLVR